MKYERLTNEELNDFTSRVVVQLEPTLTQQVMSLIVELTEYRTKIENGTLVGLPCKIGDTIYWLTSNNEIVEAVVSRIRINKYGVVFDVFEGGCEYSMFNIEIFNTKAEAEAKLKKELENEIK